MAWIKLADRSTFYEVTGTNSPYYLWDSRLWWTLYYDDAQDIANNRTKIKIEYKVQVYDPDAEGLGRTGTSNAKISGSSNIKNISGWFMPGVTYVTNQEVWVNHDSYGNGSFTFQGIGTGEFTRSTAVSTFYLPQIPRYAIITGFNIDTVTLNSFHFNVSADSAIDYVQHSLNGGAWTDSGNQIIAGLTPNTQYSLKCRVRRTDSQLWTESGIIYATTLNYAILTSVPDGITMGNDVSVSFSNPSGATTNISVYKTDGTSPIANYRECTGSGYTFDFTEAEINAMYASIPTTNSIVLRFYLRTTYGANTYYSTADRTFILTNANPTFNNFTYEDINASTVALTGSNQKIIKGYSNLRAIITTANKAVAQKGATMSIYRLVVGSKQQDASYSAGSTVNIDLTAIDNNVFVVYAIDSRGNSTSKQISPSTYIAYETVKLLAGLASRTSGISEETTLSFNGTYFNQSFGSVTNNVTAVYKYKESSSSTWLDGATALTLTKTNNVFLRSGLVAGDKGANGFDTEKSFNIKIIATDSLSTTEFAFILETARPNLDIYRNGADFGTAVNGQYDETQKGDFQIHGDKVYIKSGGAWQQVLLYDVVDTW